MRAEALQNDGFNIAIAQLVPLIDEDEGVCRLSIAPPGIWVNEIDKRTRLEIES